MVGRQLWPFPSTSNSFYRPSELTRMQFHEQQLEDWSHLSTIHNISDVSRAQSPISVASTASTASTSSLQSEEETPKGKTKKARSKSADWTEDETQDLLEAWGPRYNQLWSASQKEKDQNMEWNLFILQECLSREPENPSTDQETPTEFGVRVWTPKTANSEDRRSWNKNHQRWLSIFWLFWRSNGASRLRKSGKNGRWRKLHLY